MSVHENEKTKAIRVAALTALVGNAVLACLKIAAGALAGSGALLADGIDSSADVLVSALALAVVRVISKPADTRHPWGHRRAETVATAFLSFTLFFVGGQLIAEAVRKLLAGQAQAAPSALAMVITCVSIAGKMLLAWSQYRLGRRAGSAMVRANAKNMASDVLISVGVLAGLALTRFRGLAWADTVIAMLIGAWIIKTAAGIFLEANLELMDGNGDIEPYRAIVEAVNSVPGASNPHRARVRRIAKFWDIAFDIDVDPLCTVAGAHELACKVEREIKLRLEDVFDVMIHIEPRGDSSDETFGLSEDEMRGERIE